CAFSSFGLHDRVSSAMSDRGPMMRPRITAALRSGSAIRSRCGSIPCRAAAADACRARDSGDPRGYLFTRIGAASAPRRTEMASPKKLSHLVLQTNRRDRMVEWYCTVLGAEVL